MVFCGNEKPLWCCKNAMNHVKHECIYALCNDCFTKKGSKKRKRSVLINDESVCDHSYLDFLRRVIILVQNLLKLEKHVEIFFQLNV